MIETVEDEYWFKVDGFWSFADDSWLNVDAATLEHILEDKFGGMHMMENASEIVPQLDSFLNKSSDFQGLTLSSASAKERKTSRKMSQLLNAPSRRVSTLSNGSDVSQISSKIGFDADSFNVTMQGILGTQRLGAIHFIQLRSS